MQHRPYVITICSEKGGVGKTTLATNLAIFLKALHEDLPVTIFSFDNHFSVDLLFAIDQNENNANVGALFTDVDAGSLAVTGEYGVSFIQSSNELLNSQDQVPSVFSLRDKLQSSNLSGVVIIDTKPMLDIYTRNALATADRVLIPVKDLPSLENCKNIYGFFRQEQLSRKHLRIVPSLIEGRIKYKGAFKDQYELLRAFALNRGYRCMEGFISKSPKVDALNTNPEGKIYPILTHGKSSETYNQYIKLTGQIYQEYKEACERLGSDQSKADQAQSPPQEEPRTIPIPCLVCDQDISQLARAQVESCFGKKGEIDGGCFSDHLLKAYCSKDGETEQINGENRHLIRVQKRPPFSTIFTCNMDGEILASADLPKESMHNKELTSFLRPFVVEHNSDEPFFLSIASNPAVESSSNTGEPTASDWMQRPITQLKRV